MNGDEKARKVHNVFENIAHRYDLMNNLISFGLHKRWKAKTVELARIPLESASVLDIGCGTGDYVEIVLTKSKGRVEKVVGVDFSAKMIEIAKQRFAREIARGKVELHKADIMDLSFLPDSRFSLVTAGFILRNVSDIRTVLRQVFAKLALGGAFVSLDLAKPVPLLMRPLSFLYVRLFLPFLANAIAGAKEEYLWLFESLKTFPTTKELKDVMIEVGFDSVMVKSFGLGVVASHIGFKEKWNGGPVR